MGLDLHDMNSSKQWITNNRQSMTQFLRFVVVGVISNSIGYALYLASTFVGVPPKLAMTVLYLIGALASYIGNRRLTFNSTDTIWSSGIRYVAAHSVGYAINFMILTVFSEQYGYPHQYVQIFAMGVVAVYLFVTLKFFVFRVSVHTTS